MIKLINSYQRKIFEGGRLRESFLKNPERMSEMSEILEIHKENSIRIDGVVLSYAELKHRLVDSVRYSELKQGVDLK